jgi:hypothetical protein
MDAVNTKLSLLGVQIKAIDKAVKAALGDAAKYYLAEQQLAEVSARFAPRKAAPSDLDQKASPPPPPPPRRGQAAPPPSGNGTIPKPPPRPGEVDPTGYDADMEEDF